MLCYLVPNAKQYLFTSHVNTDQFTRRTSLRFNSFISHHSEHHPFPPPQQNHPLQPLPLPTPLPLLLNGTSSSSSKKQAGYASAPAPTKLPKLSLQPNTAAAVVGLARAVSSDQRLSSGFCWLAIVEPGDVDIDERAVVEVAVELEERMRRGMRRVLSREPMLPPLLMLVPGRREVVLLKERLGLRGW